MTTRLDLRDLCRRRLSDTLGTVYWSDEKVNQWINDAIADYSTYFPYETGYELDLTAAVHKYALTSLVKPRSILAVEYPVSQDPLKYLTWRDINDSRGFFDGDYYYVVGVPPTHIILGPGSWATAAHAQITYLADHVYPADDATVTTVPDLHLELNTLFVRYCAMQEIAAKESQNPKSNTLLAGTLALNAGRAEREYRGKVKEYLKTLQEGSQVRKWGEDAGGRIY